MCQLIFLSQSEEDTERLGVAMADVVPGGTTIALFGTLGAGKTRLVQAVAGAMGVPRESVTSPTFVLCHEYVGKGTIFHFDAYRVHDEDEFVQLGVEEYFSSDGIVFIEWADRVAACLPTSRLDVHMEITANDERKISIVGLGVHQATVVRELARRLSVTFQE